MIKTVRFAAVLFVLIAVLALLGPSLTVKAVFRYTFYPGEYFTYGTSNGSPWVVMNPSNAPPLGSWEKWANVSKLNFTVTSNPSDAPITTITFNETLVFRNGTKIEAPGASVDLDSGKGLATTFFVPAGLKQGQRVYPDDVNFTFAINNTIANHPYWPGRSICVLNKTLSSKGNQTVSARTTAVFWDQDTGVLLGAYEAAQAYNKTSKLEVDGALLYELIANNLGIQMNYPASFDLTPIYILIAISSIVVLAVVIVRFVRRPPKIKHKRLKE